MNYEEMAERLCKLLETKYKKEIYGTEKVVRIKLEDIHETLGRDVNLVMVERILLPMVKDYFPQLDGRELKL